MFLKSITVNNYRSFFGENTFEFRFNDENNINMIYGKNGCGKSTLVNAIHWCIYGEEISNENSQPICNYAAIEESKVENEIKVSVSCKFVDNNQSFIIQRECNFLKINELNEVKQYPSDLEIDILKDNHLMPVSFTKTFLNKNFPKFLFPVLLYNNERPDFCLNNHLSSNLKDFFYKFLMIDVLDSTNLHLEKLLYNYNTEIKSLKNYSEEYYRMILRQEEIESEINEIKYEIGRVTREINYFQREHKYIQDKLLDYEYDAKKEENNLYESERLYGEIYSRQLDMCLDFQKEFVINQFPILIFLSKFNEKINNEELNEMLSKNDNFRNSRFYEGYSNISSLFDKILSINQLEVYEEINLMKNDLQKKKLELQNPKSEISLMDDPRVRTLTQMQQENEKHMDELNNQLNRLKSVQSSLEKDFRHISKNIKMLEEEKKNSSELNKYEVYLRTKKFGDLVKEQLINNLINEFSKDINSFFIDSFGMKGIFNKVIVDNLFEISLLKNSSQKISINDLSSSERKIFNLSLIFAVHKCLQLEYPIILMDPFVNLDTEKRNLIVSFILDTMDNSQILLILNENQYDDSLKVNFLRNNIDEYELTKVQDNIR